MSPAKPQHQAPEQLEAIPMASPASAGGVAEAALPEAPAASGVPAPVAALPATATKRTYTSVSYVPSRSHASHPWHDLEAGENPPDLINAGARGKAGGRVRTSGSERRRLEVGWLQRRWHPQ